MKDPSKRSNVPVFSTSFRQKILPSTYLPTVTNTQAKISQLYLPIYQRNAFFRNQIGSNNSNFKF